KNFYYKDSLVSSHSGSVSTTKIKASVDGDASHYKEQLVEVIEMWTTGPKIYYNNVGVKSIQFNNIAENSLMMANPTPITGIGSLGYYEIDNSSNPFNKLKSFISPQANAKEYIFDVTNGGLKTYKYVTISDIGNLDPNMIKSSGTEINPFEYNIIKSADSSALSIYTNTGGQNAIFMNEYTLSGISNPIEEIKHISYGFSTGNGNTIALRNTNTNSWDSVGSNEDNRLTGIPILSKITSNIFNYIDGDKIYVLSYNQEKSNNTNNISTAVDNVKLKLYDNLKSEITNAVIQSDPSLGADIYINYVIKDFDADKIKIKLEYSTNSGSTRNTGAIQEIDTTGKTNNYNNDYRQIDVPSNETGLDSTIVWRTLTDLPYIDGEPVIIKLTPYDGKTIGDSVIIGSINLDNNNEWEANSSPVIVASGDADQIILKKPVEFNDDGNVAIIMASVIDIYENPIVGDSNHLLFYDSGSTFSGSQINDNNDGNYFIEYPIGIMGADINLYNYNLSDVINNRKLLLSGKTIPNGVLDIYLNGEKLTKDGGSVITDAKGNFVAGADKIMGYGKNKLKLTVFPSGGGISSNTVTISVEHLQIADPIKGKDSVNLQAGGVSGEKIYDLEVKSDLTTPKIIRYNDSDIYPTEYPTILGTTAPSKKLNITNSSGEDVGTAFSDQYGIFKYTFPNSLSGSNSLIFTIDGEAKSVSTDFNIDKNYNERSFVIDNINDNETYTLDKLMLAGFGKKDSVVEIRDAVSDQLINNFIIDSHGRFEYVLYNYSLKSGLNKLKFVNKNISGDEIVYKNIYYDPNINCEIQYCDIGILSSSLSFKNNIIIRGYSKTTELNKSAIYVYSRKGDDNENKQKLIGVIHTYTDGLFVFESFSPIEGSNDAIITLIRSDNNYKKDIYIGENSRNRIYSTNIFSGKTPETDYTELKGFDYFGKGNNIEISYKSLNLGLISNIDYSGFNSISLPLDSKGYFEGDIPLIGTGTFVVRLKNQSNQTNTFIINKN
ncbi:MAG: hypothetical protein PHF26_00505, partial [Candidatus Gracilibacteria bacterium]|nr:hypothetical protein [Candidatus Gracilibacteria bacterium]